MKVHRLLSVIFMVASSISLLAQTFEVPDVGGMSWFKGNTHAHSNRSVGNVDPLQVAQWYKTNGYQFLVLTDDSRPADVEVISKVTDSTFLLVPGLEVKATFEASWIHVNGLNANSPVYPRQMETALKTLQTSVDAVRAVGGIPQIDHPRYRDGPDRDTLLATTECSLIEVFNGGVGPFVAEPTGFLGTEIDWDFLLSAGKRVFAVASDDANTFPGNTWGYGGEPGRGWVVVRAHKMDGEEICNNLATGLFYASTGVELNDIQIEPRRIVVSINGQDTLTYTTSFIGENGKLLSSTDRNPAIFELADNSKYVRAKVLSSDGKVAWIQPVFIH